MARSHSPSHTSTPTLPRQPRPLTVPRILIHSQSLLGIGHERRTQLIADALVDAGVDTHLALGGPSALGGRSRATTHHLPTLRAADADFSALVDDAGQPVDDQYKAHRSAALAALFEQLRPDALLLELFPFGRRMLRFELLPLLAQARAANCRILCSVRDILVAKTGDDATRKRAWAVDLVRTHFDAVLVHGDPALIGFEESFTEAAALGDALHYTGLVAPIREPLPDTTRRGVLVSAGGGVVGAPLLHAARECAAQRATTDQPWTLVAGPHLPEADFQRLQADAPQHTTVIRSHPALVELMATQAVSISQAGYNTVCDLLATRTPAVLVPFSTDTETEQVQRANRLAEHTQFAVAGINQATPDALARAIDHVRSATRWPQFNLDGAAKTASLLHAMLSSDTETAQVSTGDKDALR